MRLFLAAVALLSIAAAEPPADIAPAVAKTDRPAAATALDASRKPVEVLAFMGLKRGDRVLDVMTGNGYYAEIIGNAVGPKGSVIALEPPVFLDAKGREGFASLTRRVPNVRLLEVMPAAIDLPPASIDFTLMHLTYHDTYWSSDKYTFPAMEPAAFLKRIYAATRPGGIVAVVDSAAAPGGDTRAVVDKVHRIDPAVVKADFAAAGFKLEAESDLLRNPGDDLSKLVFDPAVRGKTDRFVYRFRKPR